MISKDLQSKIKLYGKGYELLIETLKTLPKKMLKFKPAPNEWSVHEILIHLADSETNAALRARLLVAEPGRPVMAYDQDAWAVKLNYLDQDINDALKMVKYARKSTYQLLKSLPEEVFENSIIHPEFDKPYTFTMWLTVYSEHIPGHIEQIKKNYELWKQASKQVDK
jgi:hypothetical protein